MSKLRVDELESLDTGRTISVDNIDTRVRGDLANPDKGVEMVGFRQTGSGAVPRTMQDKAREVVSVLDFGAVGDGDADDSAGIQAAISAGVGLVHIPQGVYKLDSDVHLTGKVSLKVDNLVTFTGTGRLVPEPLTYNESAPTTTEFGRLVIRDGDIQTVHPSGFDTHDWMGQGLRVDSKVLAGQCGVFISGDQRQPVIGSKHYVGLHTRHNTTVDAPSVWGMNPVVVKNITKETSPTGSAAALGMEISVSNNTSEAELPLRGGELTGLFISYIHTDSQASCAMSTGGYPGTVPGQNGFKHGLWLDGITDSGTHIVLQDEVSGNAGVRRGIDTSRVTSFTDAAILLGNGGVMGSTGHKIAGCRSDSGAVCNLISLNGSNQVEIGDAASLGIRFHNKPVCASGALEIGDSSTSNSYIDFHSSSSNVDYDTRLLCTAGDATTPGKGFLTIQNSQTLFAGIIRPASDGELNNGTAAFRWAQVYAATGTINTSDEREKQDVEVLSEAESRVATTLKGLIRKFRFKDAIQEKGDNARIHVGVIAQDVKAAFEAEGLVAENYALLCYDEWEEQPENKDEEGNVMQEYRPAGNRYGVRYEELLAFIISAL